MKVFVAVILILLSSPVLTLGYMDLCSSDSCECKFELEGTDYEFQCGKSTICDVKDAAGLCRGQNYGVGLCEVADGCYCSSGVSNAKGAPLCPFKTLCVFGAVTTCASKTFQAGEKCEHDEGCVCESHDANIPEHNRHYAAAKGMWCIVQDGYARVYSSIITIDDNCRSNWCKCEDKPENGVEAAPFAICSNSKKCTKTEYNQMMCKDDPKFINFNIDEPSSKKIRPLTKIQRRVPKKEGEGNNGSQGIVKVADEDVVKGVDENVTKVVQNENNVNQNEQKLVVVGEDKNVDQLLRQVI